MAEAVFMDKLRRAGLVGQIAVDSCGTAGWHAGELPHPGAQRVLTAHNVAWNHRARQLDQADLSADYLIAMDGDNLAEIHKLGVPTGEVGLLLDYSPNSGLRDVPDPYYTDRFEETYALIEAACDQLLATIRQRTGL